MCRADAVVRVYKESDESDVIALWTDVLFDPAPHNDPAASLHRKLSVDRELLLVAVDGGELVGTAMGGYDGHRGWIYSVAVKETHRRKGIGTQLIRKAEEALKALGCPKVNLQIRSDNSKVIAFYASLGFHVEDRISMGKRM